MLTRKIATSVMVGLNSNYCPVWITEVTPVINRLQQACGGEPFNNFYCQNCHTVEAGAPKTDICLHTRKALGAASEKVACLVGN